MLDSIFSLIYFGGMVAEIIIRRPYDQARRQIAKTDQRISPTEYVVLIALFIGLFILPLLYSVTPWLGFADYQWSLPTRLAVGALGVLFLLAGLWLFGRSHSDLGTNWSPSLEINAKQSLITRGVYRSIRHPMYASQLLMSIAQALLLHNWVAGLASLIAYLPLYFLRIPPEERMMLDHFGDEYRSYCAQTGRIIPKFFGNSR